MKNPFEEAYDFALDEMTNFVCRLTPEVVGHIVLMSVIRRDTVESKRIFSIAILVALGSVINMLSTVYNYIFYRYPGEKDQDLLILTRCFSHIFIPLFIDLPKPRQLARNIVQRDWHLCRFIVYNSLAKWD